MQRIIDEYSEMVYSLVAEKGHRPSNEKRVCKILEAEGAQLVSKFAAMTLPIIYYHNSAYYWIIPSNLTLYKRLPKTRKHNEVTVQLNLLQYDCELTSKFTKSDHRVTFSHNGFWFRYVYKFFVKRVGDEKISMEWHQLKSESSKK
jgi:hypothetical protein